MTAEALASKMFHTTMVRNNMEGNIMQLKRNTFSNQFGLLKYLFGIVVLICNSAWAGLDDNEGDNICSKTASFAFNACGHERSDNFFKARANCLNTTDDDARRECVTQAKDDQVEATQRCKEQFDARQEVCDKLGESAYDPGQYWKTENFVDPLQIGITVPANPYFALIPGQAIYQGGDEVDTVTITANTKLIAGVTCLAVKDIVAINGNVSEDTDDWYAQDINGNVWYCGESSRNYEFFAGDNPQQAELVGIEGSWKAFRDYAMPGITMESSPQPGDIYRQEMLLGDAEDVAEVISNSVDELIPGDSCAEEGVAVANYIDSICNNDCIVILEYTPLEPGVSAHKYYAPNTGLVLEVTPEGECVVPAGVI